MPPYDEAKTVSFSPGARGDHLKFTAYTSIQPFRLFSSKFLPPSQSLLGRADAQASPALKYALEKADKRLIHSPFVLFPFLLLGQEPQIYDSNTFHLYLIPPGPKFRKIYIP